MSIPDPVSLDNLLSLHGRCAVVTGGSRGLGEAIKSLATIDRMSGGRLIAGIGVGWNEAEFAALGAPFHERGARTDKYLRLWQACWAPGKVSFGPGDSFRSRRCMSTRKPVQEPHPPIWIGGASDAALRRAPIDGVLHRGCRANSVRRANWLKELTARHHGG
jgi:alkanesulfonate monooxygenase SsuD/methylene tetrahydromethanopterin reductase-like flavin-dependent oxidoreductase (luciferase family)